MRRQLFIDGPQGPLWVSASVDVASRRRLPVVLVHADLGTLHQWDEFTTGIEEHHPAVAFDRRGHGRSALPRDGDFSASASALDIGAVLERLGIDRCVLIGHSGGALAAWSYAAAQPSNVAGVLLVDPPLDASTLPPQMIERTLNAVRGQEFRQVAASYYRSIAGTNPDVVERVVAEATATPQAALIGSFEAMRDFKPRLLAGRYRGPMLSIVQAQHDVAGALHRVPPGWSHKSIPGTGHWIHLDAPEAFLECAKTFLDELRAHGCRSETRMP